ncbi:transcriptional regulator [Alkalihalobacillus sp. LMS39]|uniref:transcriptional regulator n=1 Tax=Alkalihalobacillus sp. LMS39 TaxID=2924032 RepID=UPI001FB51DCC|nr:transcriptional regulator [Alkalihalobacillus sp. LMS39]UOE95121.1 transcriptional regulator [Alkalihalobacillus sp. LMS39]
MKQFQQAYDVWLEENLANEKNIRRKELLKKGLGHGTIEFLRRIWLPTVGNFDHLYPEWEVRDLNNRYRYLDLAYYPENGKGCIEIQGYGPHARDLDVKRFKDLCWRHSILALEGWTILPIAYLSITDEPRQCQQLILAFLGQFLAIDTPSHLSWHEAETLRFARRILRPISPHEVSQHLRISDRQTRRVLHTLVESNFLTIASGKARARTYRLSQL